MTQVNGIVIGDGYTRRVVAYALWSILSSEVVGARELSDACFTRGWRAIHPVYGIDDMPGEAEFRIARVGILTAAARIVTGCEDGARLDLPVEVEELQDALVDCVRTIDLNDALLAELSDEVQEDVLRCSDAAERLLEDLGRRATTAAPPSAVSRLDGPLVMPDREPPFAVPEFEGPLVISRTGRVSPA